jgi:RHS repeat-associated protein
MELITNAQGTVLERYRYDLQGTVTVLDADGNVRTTAPQSPYLFTGRRFDAESGLYYVRNRYYSPLLGKFISPDPLDYVDGMNVYAYVNGNVANSNDPMGTDYVWVPNPGAKTVTDGQWVWVKWQDGEEDTPTYPVPMGKVVKKTGGRRKLVDGPKPGKYFGQRYRLDKEGKGDFYKTSVYDRLLYERKEIKLFDKPPFNLVNKFVMTKSIYEVFLDAKGENEELGEEGIRSIYGKAYVFAARLAIKGVNMVSQDTVKNELSKLIFSLSGCKTGDKKSDALQNELLTLYFMKNRRREKGSYESEIFSLTEFPDPTHDLVTVKKIQAIEVLLGLPDKKPNMNGDKVIGTLPIGFHTCTMVNNEDGSVMLIDTFDYDVEMSEFVEAMNAFYIQHMPATFHIEGHKRNIQGTIVTGIMWHLQDFLNNEVGLDYPHPFEMSTRSFFIKPNKEGNRIVEIGKEKFKEDDDKKEGNH